MVLDLIELLPEAVVEPVVNNIYASYVLFSVLLITTGYFFPWLLIKIWNCKPLPHGPLRKRIEDFCQQTEFKYSDILLWNLFDGKLITAGILGFAKRFRYLLISPTMMEILNEDELESVVAHEMGHVKSGHVLFYLFFVLGYVIFAYAFINIIYFAMLSQDIFINLFLHSDGSISLGFYIIPGLVIISFLLIYFRYVFGFFSRNFERQSDLYAIKITGDGSGIINSLDKIAAVGSHSRTAPNWHHYSIQQRIDYVRKCDVNRDLIDRHDKKVFRMIAGYFLALIMIGGLFLNFNSTILEQSEINIILKVVERKVEADPQNPALHFILANLYYEKKLYLKAEKEYLITLAIKPLESEAINNLAWLYATSEDKSIQNPQEALRLSLKAAKLDPQPHVLDTLAESYFINGYYEDSVYIIKHAIAQNPENINYYKKQLEKFEQYLEKDRKRQKAIQQGEQFLSI
jgi:tetratricopeptide (TPR) repeat protein